MSPHSSPPSAVRTIFDKVLTEIIPSELELTKFQRIIDETTEIIRSNPTPDGIVIKYIEPQGSTGIKQTSLTNAADIDLFIGIDPEIVIKQDFKKKKTRREYVRNLFKNLVNDWLIPALNRPQFKQVELSYAEHPYVSAVVENVDLDIVVCFDLPADYISTNGPITAVDRTYHHSHFIQDHLTSAQKDDVRLLKHFFKCYYCYGDKSAVGRSGFIGYSAELMVAYYGSTWAVFKDFKNLSHTIIKYAQNKDETSSLSKDQQIAQFKRLRDAKYQNDFLIILDPTDTHRNVGASISHRAYYCLAEKIELYLDSNPEKLFEKHPVPSIKDFIQTNEELSHFFFAEYRVLEDDHYTKFRDKLYSLMDKTLTESLHEITSKTRFQNSIGELLFNAEKRQYLLAFYSATPEISTTFLRKGPKIGDEPHCTKFKKANPNSYEKDGQIFVDKARPFTQFVEFLKAQLSLKPIKKLELVKIGTATDSNLSDFILQCMGNLYDNVFRIYEHLSS